MTQRRRADSGDDRLAPLADGIDGRKGDRPAEETTTRRSSPRRAAARTASAPFAPLSTSSSDVTCACVTPMSSMSWSIATRSPAGIADARAPIIDGTVPSPDPATSTLARAATQISRKTAIARDIAPARTSASSEPSTRRRLRIVSTHPPATDGAMALRNAPRGRRRSTTSSPAFSAVPDCCASRDTMRATTSSLVNDGSTGTSSPRRRATTESGRSTCTSDTSSSSRRGPIGPSPTNSRIASRASASRSTPSGPRLRFASPSPAREPRGRSAAPASRPPPDRARALRARRRRPRDRPG